MSQRSSPHVVPVYVPAAVARNPLRAHAPHHSDPAARSSLGSPTARRECGGARAGNAKRVQSGSARTGTSHGPGQCHRRRSNRAPPSYPRRLPGSELSTHRPQPPNAGRSQIWLHCMWANLNNLRPHRPLESAEVESLPPVSVPPQSHIRAAQTHRKVLSSRAALVLRKRPGPPIPSPRAVTNTDFDSVDARPTSAKVATTDERSSALEILEKPRPLYSQEARRLKIEGVVVLEMSFGADGHGRVLRVVRGLGHGLDENAIRAATGIRFRPAVQQGRPVDTVALVRIEFQVAY